MSVAKITALHTTSAPFQWAFYYVSDEIKEDKMVQARVTHGEEK
jgi:hypothetical protein